MYEIKLTDSFRYCLLQPIDIDAKLRGIETKITADKYVRLGCSSRWNPQGYEIPYNSCSYRYENYKRMLPFLWHIKKFLTINNIPYKFYDCDRVKLTSKGNVYACYL